ncbi:MAG: dihydrodipicolinate reductase C-terminal domain-containing protein [Bacteroidia bacterium]|nr:hypothetical protein [Bacteroidia bacterium]MDW8133974.1 dihydrodipicolinate reductase C-terminal domain-containing protein [Bacteroidia bacterium]
MRLGIIGRGRMGKTVYEIARSKGYIVEAIVGRPTPAFWENLKAEAIIDFSHASQVPSIIEETLSRDIALITGTTGWHMLEEELRKRAETYPKPRWIWASNFSRGILLLKIALKAIQALVRQWKDWEIALLDIHHRWKKDAPSGTAIELSQIAGVTQIQSLRVGEVIGEHILWLSGQGEEVEFSHRAHNREIFAEGALWAAQWLVQQERFVGRFDEIWI